MKKVVSVLLALTVVVALFVGGFGVSAAEKAQIKISIPTKTFTYDEKNNKASAVDTFDVKVDLTSNSGTCGTQFDFLFDSSKLTLNSVTLGKVYSAASCGDSKSSPVKFIAYNDNLKDNKSTGNLLTLNFTVKSGIKSADLKFQIKNIVTINSNEKVISTDSNILTKKWCNHDATPVLVGVDTSSGPNGTADYTCPLCKEKFYNVPIDLPLLSKVKWTIPTHFYTGKAITPTIYGTYSGEPFDHTLILKQNVNFSILGIYNNKNAGTATVGVSAEKGYRGIKNGLQFKIVKIKVKLSKTKYTYNGKDQKPSATVYVGSKKLTNGKDYTVSYKYNKTPGQGQAIIKGKGSYAGSYTAYFTISPKAPTLSYYKSTGSKKLKVSVKKATEVTGYQFVTARNSKFTSGKKTYTSKNNKTTSVTFKGLKKKTYYYVRVRSYKKVGKTTYYGGWSKVKKVKVK